MKTVQIGNCILYHGDCLEIMPTINNHSIHSIVADLPYGTTYCPWDSIIPLDILWRQFERLIIENGATIYKTQNGGDTWQTQSIVTTGFINSLAVNPNSPQIVYGGIYENTSGF
jgi:hypothetical protein